MRKINLRLILKTGGGFSGERAYFKCLFQKGKEGSEIVRGLDRSEPNREGLIEKWLHRGKGFKLIKRNSKCNREGLIEKWLHRGKGFKLIKRNSKCNREGLIEKWLHRGKGFKLIKRNSKCNREGLIEKWLHRGKGFKLIKRNSKCNREGLIEKWLHRGKGFKLVKRNSKCNRRGLHREGAFKRGHNRETNLIERELTSSTLSPLDWPNGPNTNTVKIIFQGVKYKILFMF